MFSRLRLERGLPLPRSTLAHPHRPVTILGLLIGLMLAGLVLAGVIGVRAQGPLTDPLEPSQPAPAAPAEEWALKYVHGPSGLAVDISRHQIFVAGRDHNHLFTLDGTGKVIAAIPAGDAPWGVTYNASAQKVYVASSINGEVYVQDAVTLQPVTKINLTVGGRMPTFLTSWQHWVFVVSYYDNRLFVIDANTDQITQAIDLPGQGAWGLAIDPASGNAYVSMSGSGILVTLLNLPILGWQPLPINTFRPCGSAAGASPRAMAFDQGRNQLIITCTQDGATEAAGFTPNVVSGPQERWRYPTTLGNMTSGMITVNPVTGNVFFTDDIHNVVVIYPEYGPVATVQVGMLPEGVVYDPVLDRVLVANRGSDTITLLQDTYLPGLWQPNDVAVDPDTKRIYVTSRENDTLFVYNTNVAPWQQLYRVPVGDWPWGVAVDPTVGSPRVYVVNYGSGTVQVFDATTLDLLKTFSGLSVPTQVAVNPTTRQAFVVNRGMNELWVIDGVSLTRVRTIRLEAEGAWGVAVDSKRNLVFVSIRNGGWLRAYDGNNDWADIAGIPDRPCGAALGDEPYDMDVNPTSGKLYIACAHGGSVNRMAVVQDGNGVWEVLALLNTGNGGDNGGGGVAVNKSTGHIYFTGSLDGTVTVFNDHERRLGTLAVGRDPFGAAADAKANRVYVVLRGENRVVALNDRWYQGWLPQIHR